MFVSKRFILLVISGVIPAALSLIPVLGCMLFSVQFFAFNSADYRFSLSLKLQSLGSAEKWNQYCLFIRGTELIYILRTMLITGLRLSLETVCRKFKVDNEIIEFVINPARLKIFHRVKPTKRGEYIFPICISELQAFSGFVFVENL